MKSNNTKSKTERTREFIIEKASPVFNRKGYAGTSLTDLLEVTKLTKGSLYGNFENKDEIAVAAFEYNFTHLKNGIIAAASAKRSSSDKLFEIVKFYRQNYSQVSHNGGCPLLNSAIEADDNLPFLSEKVRFAANSLKKFIESIIQTGISKNEIRKSIDAAAYATFFIALIEGGIFLAKIFNQKAQFYMMLDKIEHMINEELVC